MVYQRKTPYIEMRNKYFCEKPAHAIVAFTKEKGHSPANKRVFCFSAQEEEFLQVTSGFGGGGRGEKGRVYKTRSGKYNSRSGRDFAIDAIAEAKKQGWVIVSGDYISLTPAGEEFYAKTILPALEEAQSTPLQQLQQLSR